MMYTKTINGRQVFSTCASIQTDEGIWISNPSDEQIAAAGWEPYVPPAPEPEPPATEPDLYEVMEAVKKMLSTDTSALSDEDALAVASLFPTWASRSEGAELQAGERLWYDGKLYKVIQAHTSQPDWTPDATPALFAEVSVEEFPDWKQPAGAADAYAKGDKVSHAGKHWVSTADANVWEPGVYGWEEV